MSHLLEKMEEEALAAAIAASLAESHGTEVKKKGRRSDPISIEESPHSHQKKKRKAVTVDISDDEIVESIGENEPSRPSTVEESNGSPKIAWSGSPCGESFFLNSLEGIHPSGNQNCVNLRQLMDVENDLESILCSSFSTDYKWFLTRIPSHVAVTVISHWNVNKDQEGTHVINGRLTVVHPPLLQYGNVHAKMMMLLYKKKMRLIISSANLTEGEWEGLTQCVWYQDFPKYAGKNVDISETEISLDFRQQLYSFLRSVKLNPNFLNAYDFTSVKVERRTASLSLTLHEVRLVISVSGKHHETDAHDFGYLRMKSVLSRHFACDSIMDSIIAYQTSSLGAICHQNWLKEFSKNVGSTTSGSAAHDVSVLFPTKNSIVKRSNMNGSDMIFLHNSHYTTAGVPKRMYDIIPKDLARKRNLLHSKIMYRTLKNEDGEVTHGWCYIGSHNLSPSAWGRYRGDFQILNYEMGVLFVTQDPSQSNGKSCGLEWLNSLPFSTDLIPYDDDDEPWTPYLVAHSFTFEAEAGGARFEVLIDGVLCGPFIKINDPVCNTSV
ncbi:hypothetical protein PROFUN_06953 [Planoprotostelium fungivorum]|uniref:Tyrosyl-DNA phosphodiesterase n=1 Tax=Planoprotostelium fungivorum TaxID=1890364 RepID=A0A2P6NN88_9EUKA|nr:hypothetical protein PROFUN_06953 [Planoprotostelium fungivorum]